MDGAEFVTDAIDIGTIGGGMLLRIMKLWL